MDDLAGGTGTQRALLQQRFLEQLPARLRDLEERVRAGRAEPAALRHWRDLGVAAQALNGAAKTHSMSAVAAGAAVIEVLCQQLGRGGSFATLASGLEAALDDIRAAVEAVAAPSMAAPEPAGPATAGDAPAQRLVYILESDDAGGDALAAQLGTYGYTINVFGTRDALRAAIDAAAPAAIVAHLGSPPEGETPVLGASRGGGGPPPV